MDDTNFSGLPVGGRRLTVVISQLQHAVAAADHGSFRQAADALSIEQSTLSVLSNYSSTQLVSSSSSDQVVAFAQRRRVVTSVDAALDT